MGFAREGLVVRGRIIIRKRNKAYFEKLHERFPIQLATKIDRIAGNTGDRITASEKMAG
jgi:hypothetical protein